MAFKAKRRISFNISGRRGLIAAVFVAVLVLGLGIGIFAIDRNLKMNVGAQGVVLTLLGPANNTFTQVGGEFDVDVYLDTKGERVTAADLKVKYDKNIFEAKSISGTSFLPTVLTQGAVDNNNGIASIVLGAEPSNPVSGNAVVAKLRLKLKSNNQPSATISIDNSSAVAAVGSDSNVVSNYGSLNLRLVPSSTVVPTPTRTPTPVVTPTPTRTPTPVVTPTPTRTPTPEMFINEVSLDRFFLTLKGPYLGGVGNKVVKVKYVVYENKKAKGEDDKSWKRIIISLLWRKWVTHEGTYQVVKEGDKEVIRIPADKVAEMSLKEPFEIYINGVRVRVSMGSQPPIQMPTQPPKSWLEDLKPWKNRRPEPRFEE